MGMTARVWLMAALAIMAALPARLYAGARYGNEIFYLCADWGPDLEAKDPEKADEIIYFVKLIKFFSPWEKEKGPSQRLWFCRMNWDGSHKKEICELWAGQNPSVTPEPRTMWMSVSPKAKKAAFSVEYGGGVSLGLFIIDLDGKNLKRLAQPTWTEKDQRTYIHPGISPDGEEVVFSSKQHGPDFKVRGHSQLGVVKVKTGEVRWLTDGVQDDHPDWSPNGDWIVYTHYKEKTDKKADNRLWLIRPDGSENKPIMGSHTLVGRFALPPDGTEQELVAWWPAWSTDGKWIYALAGNPFFYLIDAVTGKAVMQKNVTLDKSYAETSVAKLGRKGILSTGYATWLLQAEAPQFQVKEVLRIGPHSWVPSEHYGGVSTYDLKWGEKPRD